MGDATHAKLGMLSGMGISARVRAAAVGKGLSSVGDDGWSGASSSGFLPVAGEWRGVMGEVCGVRVGYTFGSGDDLGSKL